MSRGYLLPLSHSSFPPPNTFSSLSPHPYPERRSSRVVDSNGGGGERREKPQRAPVMEHADRYGTNGLCGRAGTARVA
jgi:hypothetical protein